MVHAIQRMHCRSYRVPPWSLGGLLDSKCGRIWTPARDMVLEVGGPLQQQGNNTSFAGAIGFG